jgi:hypothetical protein
MATNDELALQLQEVEAPKGPPAEKPPAEKPPDATDIALEQGNWNVIDNRLLEARQGGVVEVQNFAQQVANEPELGALAADEAALTDREIAAVQERTKVAIDQVKMEPGQTPAAELNAPAAPAGPAEQPAVALPSAESAPLQKPAEAEPAPATMEPTAKPESTELAEVMAQADALHAEAMAGSESPRETEVKKRMEEIHQEMLGLSAQLRGGVPEELSKRIRERRNALMRESAGLRNELDNLEKQRTQAESAKREEAEVDKGWEEIHAAAVAEPAAPETGASKVEQRSEAVRSLRADLGGLAKQLRQNGGYFTDGMVAEFGAIKSNVEAMAKVAKTPDIDNLLENIAHFGLLLDPASSPDAGDRLKGLNQFFSENPDLDAPGAEAAEDASAEAETPAKKGIPERAELPPEGDFEALIAIEGAAFAVAAEDFGDFFDKENGARYSAALEDLEAGNDLRQNLVDELSKTIPKTEADKELIGERIKWLKEATRLADMRMRQWEMQKLLHESIKTNGQHDAEIAETQLELDEVSRMLEANPNDNNLIKRQAALEMQLDNQSREYQTKLAWQDKQSQDIQTLGAEIAKGIKLLKGAKQEVARASAKAVAEGESQKVGEYGVKGHGQELVETTIEKSISKGVSGVVDIMGGGEDTDMISAVHGIIKAPKKIAESLGKKSSGSNQKAA